MNDLMREVSSTPRSEPGGKDLQSLAVDSLFSLSQVAETRIDCLCLNVNRTTDSLASHFGMTIQGPR
ncbi:MAG TPA: hypothetical protein VJA21_02090 [Verrucomicrobiae bacterium]